MFHKVDSVPFMYGYLLDESDECYFIQQRESKDLDIQVRDAFPHRKIVIAKDDSLRGYYVFTRRF